MIDHGPVPDATDVVPPERGHRIEPGTTKTSICYDDGLAVMRQNRGQLEQELLLSSRTAQAALWKDSIVQGHRAPIAAELSAQKVVSRGKAGPIDDDDGSTRKLEQSRSESTIEHGNLTVDGAF